MLPKNKLNSLSLETNDTRLFRSYGSLVSIKGGYAIEFLFGSCNVDVDILYRPVKLEKT